MIATNTETTITCDKCGRSIAAGEPWYQATQAAASAVFDGTAGNLLGVYELTMQLCELDFQASKGSLTEIAPQAVPVLTSA